ncbi:MAG: ABC transporter ATP-binding protein [Bacteroidetes bacterium]|nr:ABC transporter ATP-binding protein [Bacteroidota bacterium]
MLQVNEIVLRLGGNIILDKASLSLEKGKTLALVGESGSGKTSLLRVVAGLETPSEGSILINGKLVSGSEKHVEPARRGVGLVFQDFALFPHISVRKNIEFGLSRLDSVARSRRLEAMLALFQLDGLADRYPHQLSGGQQQRVALARALAPAPDLLLLDEPFSGYDLLLRDTVRRELRSLLDAAGTTTVLVTHDLQDAMMMADEIAIMRSGKVLQQGSLRNLVQQPSDDYVAMFTGAVNKVDVRFEHGRWVSPYGSFRAWTADHPSDALLVMPPDALLIARAGEEDVLVAEVVRSMPLAEGYLVWCRPPSAQAGESWLSLRLDHPAEGILLLALKRDKVRIFPH